MRVNASAPITRRDFFLAGNGRTRTLNVSCQQLYMTFIDATVDGSTVALINRLQTALSNVSHLRLRETTWLARQDFKTMLTPLIDTFRAQGGTVELV